MARDSIALLHRLITSQGTDAEAAEWAASGLASWLRLDGQVSLQRALGLGANTDRVRRAIRDLWLREAAALLDHLTPWGRAKELCAAGDKFERRVWPCWRGEDCPPNYATPLQGALFFALKAGTKLPGTARQWRNIIGDQ